MAKSSIRRFDVQAKWSLAFSVASGLCCLALMALLARNWRGDIQQILYRAEGKYQPVIVLVAGLTMLLSTVGLVFGFNSAGQRRNEKQMLSWLGFFGGTAVLALAVVLFAAFVLLRLPVTSGG
ncbi:MAG: hypothetical protein ACE5GE_13920 [Phycisphaerae bacterium]